MTRNELIAAVKAEHNARLRFFDHPVLGNPHAFYLRAGERGNQISYTDLQDMLRWLKAN